MAENTSLVSFGDLTKPATVLIEKISNAIGVLYEPTQIRRKSKAEADAAKVQAISKLEISGIEQRGLDRLIKQEARKQENIESITARAIEFLPINANVFDLEEDWLVHFFKNCENISDDTMQSLWAKILSGEASTPGRFSFRTINFVASMNKFDAKCFSDFCQFLWLADQMIALIYDHGDAIYREAGLSYETLLHLEAIGLIKHGLFGYSQDFESADISFFYQDKLAIKLNFLEDFKLDAGSYVLTKLGLELASICQPEKNESFYWYVLDCWIAKRYRPYSPIKFN